MVRQKIGILLLICFILFFIKQGIVAEIDSNQRDGGFVIAGQVTGGFLGHFTGGIIGFLCAWSIFNLIKPGPGWEYPAGVFGAMPGAIFGGAGSVYAIGEIFGSGGGSFKATLKWSILTPIGATIGYQRSKRKQPPSVSLANGKFTLHLPTMSIQSSQLLNHRPQTDYMVRLINVGF